MKKQVLNVSKQPANKTIVDYSSYKPGVLWLKVGNHLEDYCDIVVCSRCGDTGKQVDTLRVVHCMAASHVSPTLIRCGTATCILTPEGTEASYLKALSDANDIHVIRSCGYHLNMDDYSQEAINLARFKGWLTDEQGN